MSVLCSSRSETKLRLYGALLLLILALLTLSCEIEQPDEAMTSATSAGELVSDTFTLGFAPRTRTSITPDYKVLWEAGDSVWYFSGMSFTAGEIRSTEVSEPGATSPIKLKRAPEDTWYNAIHMGCGEPHFKSCSLDRIVYDGVRPLQDGSFSNAQTCMAHAEAGDEYLSFHNVTSLMRFSISRSDISTIVFRGAGAEPLAGNIRVSPTEKSPSAVADSDTSPEITISIGRHATDTFYVNVIPQTLSRGIDISLYDVMGVKKYTISSSNPLTLKAGEITDLGFLDSWLVPVITEETLFTTGNWARCTRVLEEYLECGPGSNKTSIISRADYLVEQQKEDGSWADVDYRSRDRNNWSPTTHTGYFRDIAKAYHLTGNQKYLDACRKALSCWIAKRPYSDNWWYNQIGAQRVFAPSFLLLRNALTASEIAQADNILSKATYLAMTGENKLWVAGINLQRGLLKQDAALVKDSYEKITEELRTTTAEGIQPDWSFHQHGSVMQTGVYGLSFAHDYAWWFHAFEGTTLEMSGQKREVLVNFMLKSQTWLLWDGLYDLNACGRQVGQGEQKNKGDTVKAVLEMMGLRNNYPVGAMYYPYSDFGVYRTKTWCASVRMQSIRLRGWEDTNNEDIQGYFSSDGALLIRRDGSEYNDIGACWNWKHIPGTTTYDNGKPLRGAPTLPPFNPTSLVFGTVIDSVMVAAMDCVRDGLTARKAWFFHPGGIVCLGAGITMSKGYEVTTTLEQSTLGGVRTGQDWYTHRGITYYLMDGGPATMIRETRNGKWSDVCPSYSTETVSKGIFELTISHGTNPKDASYAYAVSPEGLSGAAAVELINKTVSIESNTKTLQSVTINGRTYTIDWQSGTIR